MSATVAVTLAVTVTKIGGDGWESNPPRTPQQRPANGFEDRGGHQPPIIPRARNRIRSAPYLTRAAKLGLWQRLTRPTWTSLTYPSVGAPSPRSFTRNGRASQPVTSIEQPY